MTATAMLMKEIETLPEESVAEILDFALFLRTRNMVNTDGLKTWSGLTPSMKNPSYAENFRKIPREELYDRF